MSARRSKNNPEPGALVRIKRSFQTDRRRPKTRNFPQYLQRAGDYEMMEKDVFVLYLGVKQIQRGANIFFVYSFIHDGIVWNSGPRKAKPKQFLARHVVVHISAEK